MNRKERAAVRALVFLDWEVDKIASGLGLPLLEVAPAVAREVRRQNELRDRFVDRLREIVGEDTADELLGGEG